MYNNIIYNEVIVSVICTESVKTTVLRPFLGRVQCGCVKVRNKHFKTNVRYSAYLQEVHHKTTEVLRLLETIFSGWLSAHVLRIPEES